VPERAYVSARLLAECRGIGRIKSFNENHGYGFIECPDVAEAFDCDVFLHHCQVGPFQVGDEVSFALLLNKDRKPQAFDLAVSKDGRDLRGQTWPGGANGDASQRQGAQDWSSTNSSARSSSAAGKPSGKGKSTEKGDDWGASKTSTPRVVPPLTSAKGGEASSSAKGKGSSKGPKEGKASAMPVKSEVQSDVTYSPTVTTRRRGAAMAAYGAQLRAQVKGKGSEKGAAKASDVPQDRGRVVPPISDKGSSKGKVVGPPRSSATSGKYAGPSNDAAGSMEEIPGLTDRWFEGYIKSFNTNAGWGFIANEEIARMRGGDVFLHSNALGSFDVGDYVSFWIRMNKDGRPQACDLKAADPGGGKNGKKRPAGGGEKGGKGSGGEWESGGARKKGR